MAIKFEVLSSLNPALKEVSVRIGRMAVRARQKASVLNKNLGNTMRKSGEFLHSIKESVVLYVEIKASGFLERAKVVKKAFLMWNLRRLVRGRQRSKVEEAGLVARIDIAWRMIVQCRVRGCYFGKRGAIRRAEKFVWDIRRQHPSYDPRRFLLEIRCEADVVAEMSLRTDEPLWTKPIKILQQWINRCGVKEALKNLLLEQGGEIQPEDRLLKNVSPERMHAMTPIECEVAGRAFAILGYGVQAQEWFLRALGGEQVFQALVAEDRSGAEQVTTSLSESSNIHKKGIGPNATDQYSSRICSEVPSTIQLAALLGIAEIAIAKQTIGQTPVSVGRIVSLLVAYAPEITNAFFRTHMYYRLISRLGGIGKKDKFFRVKEDLFSKVAGQGRFIGSVPQQERDLLFYENVMRATDMKVN